MTRRNLCVNPALSVDASGWGGGSVPSRAAVTGFARPWVAHYSSGTYLSSPVGNAGPDLPYTVSAFLRSNVFAISGGTLYIEFLRSAGGSVFVSTGFTAAAGVVTRVFHTATAPANTTGLRIIAEGTNFAVSDLDITGLLIEQMATLADYFDGDSPGASWDGVPGLSSSTLADAAPVSGTAYLTLPAFAADLAGAVTGSGRLVMTLPPLVAALSGQVNPPGAAGKPPARLITASGTLTDLTGATTALATLEGGEA